MGKKKSKKNKSGNVIIPNNHPTPPSQNEVDVALTLSSHYKSDVEFIIPVDDYMRKSADIVMNGVEWEIKCPHGNSRSTIGNQLRWASKQSKSIILETRRTKLPYEAIEKKVRQEVNRKSSINRAIIIDKSGKVVEIKK